MYFCACMQCMNTESMEDGLRKVWVLLDHVRMPSALTFYMYHRYLPVPVYAAALTVGVTSEKGLFIAGLRGWHRSKWKQLLRRTASKTFSFSFFYVVFTLVFIYLLLKIIFGTWLNPGLITCAVNVSSLSHIPGLFIFSLLAASLVWTAPSYWWQCSWDKLAKPIHKCSF